MTLDTAARRSTSRPTRWPDPAVHRVWRGLPILVHALRRCLPAVGQPAVQFDPYTLATITLTLWGSAQVAEAPRGAFQSIIPQHGLAALGWLGRPAPVRDPAPGVAAPLPPVVSLLENIIQNSTNRPGDRRPRSCSRPASAQIERLAAPSARSAPARSMHSRSRRRDGDLLRMPGGWCGIVGGDRVVGGC